MWEMYEHARGMDDHRFQELYSDEDDLVLKRRLNPKSSDDFLLQHNLRSGRYSARSSEEHLAYGNRYDSSDDDEDSEGQSGSQQLALRSQEDLLAQRAQERIRKAKAKGRPTVNLTHEELEALERRFASDMPDRQQKKSAAGSSKGSPSRNGAWTRRRSSSRPASVASGHAKQRAKGAKKKSDITAADEAYSSGAAPPGGVMIPGPNGAPVFSPLGYYNAQPATFGPGRGDDPRKSPIRGRYSGPPPTSMQYPIDASRYRQSRHASNASDFRPPSSSSRASSSTYFSEADYWTRSRSSSNAAPYPSESGVPPSAFPAYGYPAAAGAPSGRRVVSGPPDVGHAHVYRRPVPPTAQMRGRPPQSNSDPALGHRASSLHQEYGGSSSEDEDEEAGGYEQRVRGLSHDRRSRT